MAGDIKERLMQACLIIPAQITLDRDKVYVVYNMKVYSLSLLLARPLLVLSETMNLASHQVFASLCAMMEKSESKTKDCFSLTNTTTPRI